MNYYVLAYECDDEYVAEIDSHPDDLEFEWFEFDEGKPLASRISNELIYEFSEDNEEGRRLIDLQDNALGVFFVSPKLREVLSGEGEIEFLPITFLNHRGEVASKDFCIANVLTTVDCIDFENTDCVFSALDPEDIERIKAPLVLDELKIPSETNIFRLGGMKTALIINEILKDKIVEADLEGPLLVPVEEFDSIFYLGA